MSSPCSTAWAEGNSPADPWSSSPGLQSLSVLGLLRADPLTTCQGTHAGLWVWFLVRIWFLASSTGSCSAGQTGESGWASSALQLRLKISLPVCILFRFGTRDCKIQHSNLPKDLDYHEGLNSGSEVKWFLFFRCQHKINFDNSCKMEEKLFSDFVCQNSSLGPSCLLFFFLQNFIMCTEVTQYLYHHAIMETSTITETFYIRIKKKIKHGILEQKNQTNQTNKRPLQKTVHPKENNWSQYSWQYFHFSKAQHFFNGKKYRCSISSRLDITAP